MTAVPLPDTPCVRVRLDYQNSGSLRAGSRFYLAYSGSAPTGANCTTLAGDIATIWGSDLAGMVNTNFALVEVDVLDIATDSGLSGQWSGSIAGSRTGNQEGAQVATNVEFGIARRYRGGKPRMFLPPPVSEDRLNDATWSSSFVTAVNTNVAEFFTAVEALSVGAMGTLRHVNLSYYQGFHNITNSSGRERAVPTYRDTAKSDTVTGYFTKAEMGSQRRRRTATSY